ncbi:hypothetical protein E3P77_02956 [Wallemia ichthyophaga]|uniref:cystathionine gamma-lyase n=1 Tax=Wallemia ichthyophaga TaxID=245174 RepID=A0A4T0GC32_WALIC|nr:hypothetical protein E3P95_02756 [Wallemia ichthyophaga]TIA98771.1 hypothetical protein E3P94_02825 [Wallemia ichthyophaga]TIB10944.1 hypothetical protein E3P90_02661 [Wallemia ichthyophaga]TIB11183.1 hypothetical protein E3P93_02669 [Wallemia ichthyophaga]TIB21440.1 hypothetical protein E3P89_02645 [Wallemia ichthyophaga]
MDNAQTSPSFATRAIHVGSTPDESTGAVIPPISLSTTYAQTGVGNHKGFEYSRSNNPNREALERQIAALENGKYGFAFASGSAAASTLLHLLGHGPSHVISIDDVYGGTSRYFTHVASLLGVQTSFVPLEGTVEEAVIASNWKKHTKMIWVESPTNPTMKIVNIPHLARIAHSRDVILVVDNTFLSPYYSNPLDLGADVVLHSVSKYINGHSDVIMGVVVTKHQHLAERLRFFQNAIGSVPSAFDCWLAQRGAKTLHLRAERHGENALKLAHYFATEGVKRGWVKSKHDILYPGLPWNANYDIMKEQMSKHVKANNGDVSLGVPTGGMLSVSFSDSVSEAGEKILERLTLFSLAESLGGVESLAELPSKMTHAGIPKALREELGINQNLVRFSVGVEDYQDLENDIRRAAEDVYAS